MGLRGQQGANDVVIDEDSVFAHFVKEVSRDFPNLSIRVRIICLREEREADEVRVVLEGIYESRNRGWSLPLQGHDPKGKP